MYMVLLKYSIITIIKSRICLVLFPQELAKADAKHFIILFRDAQLQFRSVYSYSPDTEELWKLFGVGPRHITQKMYENLYKWVVSYQIFTDFCWEQNVDKKVWLCGGGPQK